MTIHEVMPSPLRLLPWLLVLAAGPCAPGCSAPGYLAPLAGPDPRAPEPPAVVTLPTRPLADAPHAATPPATPALSLEAHNLRGINAYRATLGLAPLVLDPGLSAFALEGSRALARERRAHGHFRRASRGGALFRLHGFAGHAAENQGDPNGWPPMASVEAQIDDILAAMWREGPGGGHYDAMANPRLKRVGIGLLTTPDGRLYLTNDFSG